MTGARLATLREALSGTLPGRAAHARFEPDLAFGRHSGPAPVSARAAAVMLLLYERGGEWFVPLTVRPAHLTHHAGQVSLPGGLVEPGETSRAAALRELDEELGINAGRVSPLGELSPLYLYVTDFLITPHVGVLETGLNAAAFVPSPDEVAEVIEAPLTMFAASGPCARVKRGFRSLSFFAPAMCIAGHEVWGATAMMLAELGDVWATVNRSNLRATS
jgi:8-oxo-dGTP pyrophosphatase MutT (NUDIX family)